MSEVAFVGRSVLVVDDDPVTLEMVSGTLDQAGFKIFTVTDSREALQAMRHRRPDLVIMDWLMPDPDGLVLCRAIRDDDTLRHTYIVMLTTRCDVQDCVLGLESGANDFLTKPCESAELIARVRAGFRIRNMQREIASMQHTRALLKMAVTLGHEINNPLTAVLGNLKLVVRDLGDEVDSGVAEKLETCVRESQRIDRIVTQLRQLKKPITKTYIGEIEMLDLHRSSQSEAS